MYEAPGHSGSPVELQDRYDNFIGGEWVPPTTHEYRESVTPSTGEPFCEVAHSSADDIELALDAAHAVKGAWGKRSPAERAAVLDAVADAMEEHLEMLAVAEVIGDLLPPGVLNIVNGPGGASIGKALASNKRIAKIAFTGETVTGRLIMSYAAQNLIPSTTELGGKSPNIFFDDVMAADDAFLDKAIEGLVLCAFNKGEVCTCPSRALIQESIYGPFLERCLERIRAIKQGDPLDRETMIGAQVSTAS